MASSSERDGIYVRDDGVIDLVYGTRTTVLGRPNIGQYRARLEALDKVNTDTVAAQYAAQAERIRVTEELKRWLDAAADADGPDEATAEDLDRVAKQSAEKRAEHDAACRRIDRDLRSRIDELRVGWMRATMQHLAADGSDLPPGDADAWPAWLASDAVITKIVDAWGTVPFRSGASAPAAPTTAAPQQLKMVPGKGMVPVDS